MCFLKTLKQTLHSFKNMSKSSFRPEKGSAVIAIVAIPKFEKSGINEALLGNAGGVGNSGGDGDSNGNRVRVHKAGGLYS